jgi:hypothetical protein
MSPRAALALVGLLAAGLVAGLVWVLVAPDPPPVDLRWRVLQVVVGNPEEVSVTFVVTKSPATRADCQVAAFDEEGKSVGRLTGIDVPPRVDGARESTLNVTVPTPEGQAVRASIAQCVLVGGSASG